MEIVETVETVETVEAVEIVETVELEGEDFLSSAIEEAVIIP